MPADATPQPARPTCYICGVSPSPAIRSSDGWRCFPTCAAPLASSPSAEPVSEQEQVQEHLSKTENDQQREPVLPPSGSAALQQAFAIADECADELTDGGDQRVAGWFRHIARLIRLHIDTELPERAPAIAVDCSRPSPNEVAPAAARTSPTLIGEAPLASAPSDDPAFADADAVLRHLGYATLADRLLASLQSERLARETAEQELRRVIMECNQTDSAQVEALWPSAAEIVRCKMLELDMLLDERETARRVHLRRHTRLAEALGMDPGYSADATINKAIEVIRAAPHPETRP